jgi:quercetin dioxygenase-like cupin family protein
VEFSRRALTFLLLAVGAAGQKTAPAGNAPRLEGKVFKLADLPWHGSVGGISRSKAIFNGYTTRGQRLTMHATELAAGQRPHPAARQPHEEILIVEQGIIECTINGQTATLGPGDVVYSAFNDLKDWKNSGTSPAVYYVISLEDRK